MVTEKNVLTVGKVAKAAQVGIDTVRFYEREGLIPAPPRRPSGYREYPKETVARLRFVLRAKELGFSLKEIRELLGLRQDSKKKCKDVEVRASAKILEVESKIEDLVRIRDALKQLKKKCGGGVSVDRCPIIASFEEEV